MHKKLKRFFKLFGPGFITGASDDDPSGIGTYSQTGAKFGYTQLWMALFSTPFMIVIQEMCGRIGLVTGRGLAGVIRKHYSKTVLRGAVALLIFANTINIGANLGAMAEATQLIIGGPFTVWIILLTLLTLVLEIFVSYRTYSTFLKYLTLSLFAYVITVFLVQPDWGGIAWATFIPHLAWNRDYVINIIALLGTTISPYLFFWQADEEVEEEIANHKLIAMGRGIPKINGDDINHMRWDTVIGMVFSNIITFFVIATTAATLHLHNITDISSATQAAEALRPLAGNYATLVFAVGIIGTGLLAVPVLAGSASYALAESLHWKVGLYRKFKQAHGFYGIIILATVVGLLINFTDIPPFTMLYYAAVLNGLIAPILLIFILVIANNAKIMGKHTNSRFSNILGSLITGIMLLASIGLILTIVWN